MPYVPARKNLVSLGIYLENEANKTKVHEFLKKNCRTRLCSRNVQCVSVWRLNFEDAKNKMTKIAAGI